ncbi:MAG: F-box protein [Parachlamydiaceae bacterium]
MFSCFPSFNYYGLITSPDSDSSSNSRKQGLFDPRFTDEVIQKIFSFLPPRDLCNAGQACRKWQQISKSDPLWAKLCQTHYPDLSSVENKQNLKELFALFYEGEKRFENLRKQLEPFKHDYTRYVPFPIQGMSRTKEEGYPFLLNA